MASFWAFTHDAESKIFLAVAIFLPIFLIKYSTWETGTCYVALVLTTYLANRCLTPPVLLPAIAQGSTKKDSERNAHSTLHSAKGSRGRLSAASAPEDVMKWVANPSFRGSIKLLVAVIGFYHASIALCLPSPPRLLCPYPGNLNVNLFTWSSTAICLMSITAMSALSRMSTYHQLGQNFTFDLAAPTHLVTDGLYTYIRHPSYTFFIIAMSAYQFLVFRLGGVVACWDGIGLWAQGCIVVQWCLFGFGIVGLVRRIEVEEAMMKGSLGREWEVWRGRTWRLVPGVW